MKSIRAVVYNHFVLDLDHHGTGSLPVCGMGCHQNLEACRPPSHIVLFGLFISVPAFLIIPLSRRMLLLPSDDALQ
eukprot:scaffold3822_cov42-Attheya_sp.AAC.2